jgi:hypothetical protein
MPKTVEEHPGEAHFYFGIKMNIESKIIELKDYWGQ